MPLARTLSDDQRALVLRWLGLVEAQMSLVSLALGLGRISECPQSLNVRRTRCSLGSTPTTTVA